MGSAHQVLTQYTAKNSCRFGSKARVSGLFGNGAVEQQQRCRSTWAHGEKPTTAAEVLQWARWEFEQEVSGKDEDINLARACLLVTLEEEAAAELESTAGAASRPRQAETSGLEPQIRQLGLASTWNLERLDALAAEVCAALDQLCWDDASAAFAVSKATNAASEALHERQESHSTAGPSDSPPNPDTAEAVADLQTGSAASSEGEQPTAAQRALVAVSALNRVLFNQHGYKRMARHGDPRDSKLPSVLERGTGTPATLAILYMQISERLGFPLAAKLLEGGRYFVLWPQNGRLETENVSLCIDAYSSGDLLTLDEVREHFSSDLASMQPASKREILAAVLAALRDAHWALGMGCKAEPALMLPLDAATACALQEGLLLDSYHINRAMAAARRRLTLLPQAREVQLEYALLLYFGGLYEDAWQELAIYLEGVKPGDYHLNIGRNSFTKVQILAEKVRLTLQSKDW